jgi:hypothetical protein
MVLLRKNVRNFPLEYMVTKEKILAIPHYHRNVRKYGERKRSEAFFHALGLQGGIG